MSIGPLREDTAEVNEKILRWLKRTDDEKPMGKEMAAELGLSVDAFYQRAKRLRRGQTPSRFAALAAGAAEDEE